MVAVEKSSGWLRNSRRTAPLFCQRSPDQLSATLHFVVIQKQSQTRGRLANRPPFCCISLFVSRLFSLFATPFSTELLTQRDVLLMKMKKLSIFSLIPPLPYLLPLLPLLPHRDSSLSSIFYRPVSSLHPHLTSGRFFQTEYSRSPRYSHQSPIQKFTSVV